MTTTTTRQLNVVIADDHGVVRAGLRLMLEQEPGIHVVGEAEDVPGALALVERHRPDVLVLDLTMPGPSSLDAIPQVRGICPRTRVIVLTMQTGPAFARAALQAGAAAYVLKDSAAGDLVDAIRAVSEDHTYLDPHLGAQLAVAPQPLDGLSGREMQVLRMVALGHTNGEIAAGLSLSIRTVETHRAHIQRKLGRSSRSELVRYALDHGLLVAGPP